MSELSPKLVTTPTQAKALLDSGEILMNVYEKGSMIYINKVDDKYMLTFQPKHGSGKVYEGSEEMINKFLISLEGQGGLEFVVIRGAELDHREATLVDKLADKIRNKFKK